MEVPASAQGTLADMQWFAPPNLSTYGGPRRANQGFFFTFEHLIWSVSQPETTTIGQFSELGREVWYGPDPADSATQNNSHDTSIFDAEFVTGQRFEGGFIYGHQGLLFSAWRLNHQTQDHDTAQLSMVFDDSEWGGALDYKHLDGYVDPPINSVIKPLPVTFASSRIRNRVETWGLELMYLMRSRQMHSGGYFEFFAGARYLEFNDEFSIHAYGYPTPVTISGEAVTGIIMTDDPAVSQTADDIIYVGTLANSIWYQEADNRIVGPQIGGRWFNHYGRWTVSAEGRFFAGFNSQTLYQTGIVGSKLNPTTGMLNEPSLPGHPAGEVPVPLSLEATEFTHEQHENEWSPGIEVRFNLNWQWTKNIAIGAGWSGLWLDGIARSSNLIDYQFGTASTMGIVTANNRQDVFIQGATFQIQLNR
jgi:hypothetical protein